MTPLSMIGVAGLRPVRTLMAAAAPAEPGVRRVVAVALLVVLLLAMAGAAARGWRSRAARQAQLPPPGRPPEGLGEAVLTVSGSYVGTTVADQFLNRIVAHGLGVPARARLAAHPEGLVLSRDGADPVFLPTVDVLGVGLSAGMTGKVPGRQELVLIRWRAGQSTLDTGFRPARREDRQRLSELAEQLQAILRPDATMASPGPTVGRSS